MYNPNADASPFNPLPPVVLVLAGLIAAVEIVFQAGESGFVGGPQAIGWRLNALEDYAFFEPLWSAMWRQGFFPPEHVARFVTYPFLHGNFTHAVFAVVIVLAIGKVVGEVFSTVAFLALFFLSAICGAVIYWLLVDSQVPLIGAYPGAYGLIGGFTFLLWTKATVLGENTYRAFTLIGFLMGIQLVFGLLFGGGPEWIADLAGFCAGFGMSFVISPGGWARLLARTRNR